MWILAEGDIEVGTTDKLKAFVTKKGSLRNIRFNSPGGNLIEAIKLGEFLRVSGFDAYVGEESVQVRGKPFDFKTQKSVCYSACVYAFGGGVHRSATDKSIGIHQFYRPDEALRPNDKTLSAIDMANTQQLTALLNEYVRRMGIDPRLISIASGITPWEPIYLVGSAELVSLNLDNISLSSGDASWSVQPAGNGAIAITRQQQNGAGRVASFGIMCFQSRPSAPILLLDVVDDTVNWSLFNSSDLMPQNFVFQLDGQFAQLPSDRLVDSLKLSAHGISLMLSISENELQKIMLARSVEIAAFANMATQRATGELGGTFSMTNARAVIGLALKNCAAEN